MASQIPSYSLQELMPPCLAVVCSHHPSCVPDGGVDICEYCPTPPISSDQQPVIHRCRYRPLVPVSLLGR